MLKLPHNQSAPTAGFALVLALSLMAFVLLLLLSITTLVRVETSASGTAISRMEAQQNALLGVYLAVGELQRGLGPDQRVTAPADLLDSAPDTLESEGVLNPYWLAAYPSVQPGSEAQTLETLRAWSTDQSAADRVNWFVSARTDLSGAGVNPATTDVVALNGGDASQVITLARYKDNADAVVDVRAGKLDITNQSDSVDGRYAWWVADESAKFRINVTKDDVVLDSQPFDPRWSLMAPHQSNPSVIPELSSFDVADPSQKAKMARVSSADSLQLLDPSWETWTRENSDDYTTVAQSIPVDVTQGRLKEDLSVYLGSDLSGLNDSDFIVRGSATDLNYRGQLSVPAFQMDHSALKLPQFGLLKSWYTRGMDLSGLDQGTPAEPRAQAPDASGLHPVILRTALYFGVSYEIMPDGSVMPVYLVYPKFVLWNPHNVPIAPAKYIVQVRAFTTINTQINADLTDDGIDNPRSYAAVNITPGQEPFGYQGNLPAQPANNTFAHMNFAGGGSWALERDAEDSYPYFTFVIDNQGFAPGETLYFTGADKHPNGEYVDTEVEDVSADFNNHNLLVNADEGPLGFFYLPSGSFLTPLPNQTGDPVPTTGSSDTLQTTIYFRDTLTNAPDGNREPSLSSKLYHYSTAGDVELLQELNLKGPSYSETQIDWEHIDTEGNSGNSWSPLDRPVSYRSLDYYKNTNPFEAVAHRGHGYFISPMASPSAGNKARMMARHNFVMNEVTMADPLVSNLSSGRIYSDSIPTDNWFSGPPFPSEIPEDISYAGIVADGYDRPGGYGLYQNSSNFSQGTVYPLYDSVRMETDLFSIGFLKNVNFSQFYWQPTFTVGNSEAHTHVHRNNIKATQGSTVYTDLSYLLNESLFDRFYLSTIPQTGVFNPTADLILPNTRNRLVAGDDGTFASDTNLRNSPTAFAQSAASIAIEGGFNVNSTSVDAWRMLLASYLGESVLAADGSASHSLQNSALTSKLYPLLAEGGAVDPSAPEAWSAVRSLTVNEIDLLAEAIVEEVKRRGPFLSLADFVNRRLVGNSTTVEGDYLGLKGTLQAAIDKLSISGQGVLNEAYYQGSLAALALNYPDGVPVNSSYPEHETGMPGGLGGSRMFGVPGFLTQGDLLSAIAPILTVRGDTFTIRAYGESLSGISDKVESKVWCEAVVQRVADPVAVGDSVVAPTGDFGRSFRILSIRWLNEADVI
ncbi:hypothetical protein [Thalassobacterium maritimum]|nr:hypothetical protein [Coraliomargarita sp. SDUM461003]